MNDDKYIFFKLYIIKQAPTSPEIILKLKSFLDSNFKNCYVLDVIDILAHPDKAVMDNVMASPTLIKDKPYPQKRVVGSIHFSRLLADLNLYNYVIN